MKTTNLLWIFTFAALVCSCKNAPKPQNTATAAEVNVSTGATRQELNIVRFDNYSLKQDAEVDLSNDVNFIVIKDADEFNALFNVEKSKEGLAAPDFTNHTIVAVVGNPDGNVAIKVERVITEQSGQQSIYVETDKESSTKKSSSMVLLALPKQIEGTPVKVVKEGETVVAIGTL